MCIALHITHSLLSLCYTLGHNHPVLRFTFPPWPSPTHLHLLGGGGPRHAPRAARHASRWSLHPRGYDPRGEAAWGKAALLHAWGLHARWLHAGRHAHAGRRVAAHHAWRLHAVGHAHAWGGHVRGRREACAQT